MGPRLVWAAGIICLLVLLDQQDRKILWLVTNTRAMDVPVPPPPPQMEAGVGCGNPALFLSPEDPGHLRHGTGVGRDLLR